MLGTIDCGNTAVNKARVMQGKVVRNQIFVQFTPHGESYDSLSK